MRDNLLTVVRFIVIAVLALSVVLTVQPTCSMARNTSLRDRIGIFNVPRHRQAMTALKHLGVRWVRVQIPLGEKRKNLVRGLQAGHALWITLNHRDAANVREAGTVGFSQTTRGGFAPRNPLRYQQLVVDTLQPLVQFLKTQGKNPGHWLVVQVGNEILPRDVAGGDKAVRFWHGTADEYLALLALTNRIVKGIDSRIPVAAGGISSAMMNRVLDGERRLVAWNRRLLTEGRFDWADVHLRHNPGTIRAKLNWIRRYWRGPLAATEFAYPDPRHEPYTAHKQVRMIRRWIPYTLQIGVDRVFWASLVDDPRVAVHYQHEGLIERDPWRMKPGFEVLRDLIKGGQG